MEQLIENPTTVDYDTVAAATAAVLGAEPVRALTPSATVANTMYKRVEQLAIEREVWQEGEYARSNETLYGLIGKCKALYDELTNKADGDAKAKRAGFDDYLNLKDYVFKSSTELTYKVIRAVFGDKDRRRLSTYHTVLRVAVKQGWKVDEFAARITEYGGVQEISLGAASGQMTAKQKAEIAKSAVMDEVVAVLKSDALSKAFSADKIGEKAVAVLTQEPDGSFSVHAVVHNNSAVTAALAAYYAANKAALKDAVNKQQVADAQQHRAEAIDAAAMSVVNG
jgi:hypothetical protein